MTTPTREQLFQAAAALDMLPGDHGDVAEYLRAIADDPEPAVWAYHGGYSGSLYACDPGRPAPLTFRNVPDFAFHVDSLLTVPRHLVDVSPLTGPAKRGNVHAEKRRLADRLDARNQKQLAEAIREDVHLEQYGDKVLAVYDPVGRPLALAD